VLRLCESVLASLGSENRSAAAQSLHFLTGHEEVVALILRGSTARASLAPALLQELALLTAVVSRAATLDLRSEAAAMDATSFELSGQLARIQRQMLSLLQLFQLNESLVATLEEDAAADRTGSGAGLSRSLLVMQIVANVVSYSRAVVSAGGSSARSCRLVVSPALLEVAEGGGSQATGRPASLGLLVMTTRHLAAQLAKIQVGSPSFPTLACLPLVSRNRMPLGLFFMAVHALVPTVTQTQIMLCIYDPR
jgi:nuclear pore complex protein Nup205